MRLLLDCNAESEQVKTADGLLVGTKPHNREIKRLIPGTVVIHSNLLYETHGSFRYVV